MLAKFNRYSYFYTIAASFLLILFIPLLIIGVISYYSFKDIVNKEIEKNSSEFLKQIVDTIDIRFDELNKLSSQLQNDPFFLMARYPSNNNEVNIAFNHLSKFAISNSFINDYFIYYNDIDYIFSNIGVFNKTLFFNNFGIDEFNSEIVFKDKILINDKPLIIGPCSIASHLISVKNNVFIYIVPLPYNDKDKSGAMIFIINEETIKKMLSVIQKRINGRIFMFDGNFKLISVYGDQNTELNSSIVNKINNKNFMIPIKTFLDGKSYYLTGESSKLTSWTIICAIPEEVISMKFSFIKKRVLFGFLFTFLFGIFVIRVLSRKNLKPIQELLELVSTHIKIKSKKTNELQIVKLAISQMDNKIINYSEKLKNLAPTLKNKLLMDFIKGRFNSIEEFNDVASEVGITLVGDMVTVVVVFINHIDSKLNSKLLIDNIEKCAVNDFSVCGIDLPLDNHFAFVFSAFSKNYNRFNEILENIKSTITHDTFTDVSIGVGNWYASIRDIGLSYLQSTTAIDYRFIKGKNTIIFFQDLQPKNSNLIRYQEKNLETLIYSISQRNTEKINSIITEIINEIKNSNMPLFIAKSLCYNVLNLMLNSLKNNNKKNDIKDSNYLDVFLISNFDNIETFEKYLRNICSELYDNFKDIDNTTIISLSSKIVEYIENHYTEFDFSLNKVSSYFNISMSNLSNYFKAHTNINITSYVRHLRIEKAKQLLVEEDSNLQIISQKVGYDNILRFIRNFKQSTGVTPGAYRESLKQ